MAAKYGIPLIEDCSYAHGARYKGQPCCSLGDVDGVPATNSVDILERACRVGRVNCLEGIDLVSGNYI